MSSGLRTAHRRWVPRDWTRGGERPPRALSSSGYPRRRVEQPGCHTEGLCIGQRDGPFPFQSIQVGQEPLAFSIGGGLLFDESLSRVCSRNGNYRTVRRFSTLGQPCINDSGRATVVSE